MNDFDAFKIKRVVSASELDRKQKKSWPQVLEQLSRHPQLKSGKAFELKMPEGRFNTLRTALSVAIRHQKKHRDLYCMARKGHFFVGRI